MSSEILTLCEPCAVFLQDGFRVTKIQVTELPEEEPETKDEETEEKDGEPAGETEKE